MPPHALRLPDMERLRQSSGAFALCGFGACDDGVVKRSTAVNRLAEIAAELERSKLWRGATVVAGYVFGATLENVDDVERVQIAVTVDEPVENVPWMSHPAHLEALASLLRFDKLPMSWWWRPMAWPVWNHEITRAACFWSAQDGVDQAVLDALAAGSYDQLQFVEPSSAEELIAQVRTERDIARRHLEDAVAGFHEREWRREHKGDGVYPGDHLWSAAAGFLDLDNSVERLED
jgi:hypothetical protein